MKDAMDLPEGTKIRVIKLNDNCGWSDQKEWIEGQIFVMGKDGNYHLKRGNTKVTEKGFDNSQGFYFFEPKYEIVNQ